MRRAPGRLLRSGQLAVMVVVSVALLAGLVAAGPLYGAATAAGGLARRLATIPATDPPAQRPAVRITVYNGQQNTSGPGIPALANAIPYVGPGQTAIAADAWQQDSRHPTPYFAVGTHQRAAVLYFRTGALDHLQITSGAKGAPGIWIPEGAAHSLNLHPGQVVTVGKTFSDSVGSCGNSPHLEIGEHPTDTQVSLPVAGTYRTAPDGRLPAGSYFAGISGDLPSDPTGCPTNALLLFTDLTTINTALGDLAEQPIWTYEVDVTQAGRSPVHMRQAASAATALRVQASQPGSPTARLFEGIPKGSQSTVRGSTPPPTFRIDSGLPAIVAEADADAAKARQQGRGIGYAGGILGLAAVLMGLRALSQRRRRETELLLGIGAPTGLVVAAGVVELILPALVGAAVGCAAAVGAFDLVGPHPQIDHGALRSAIEVSALVALIALACDALITLTSARQISRELAGRERSTLGSHWLPLLTGATVFAVAETLTRDRNASATDPLGPLLPILVLACGCAVLTRLVSSIATAVRRVRSLRTNGRRLAADRSHQVRPDVLILRGLRRTGVAVGDLVIVLGIGIGVLAYGLTSAALVSQSVTDKAAVMAGADTSVQVTHSYQLGGGQGPSPRLAPGSSVVWRASAVMTPDNQVYDLLVVDPTLLPSAVTWGAGDDLSSARAALTAFPTPQGNLGPVASAGSADGQSADAQPPIPAILVGPSDRRAGSTAKVQLGIVTFPVTMLRHVDAFPGASRPTLVIDARTLFPRLGPEEDPSRSQSRAFELAQGDFTAWVWTRDPLPTELSRLASRGVEPISSFTLTQARATPVLTSGQWSAAYQVVLGFAAAALAGLAIVLAVDRRVARAASVDLVLHRFGIRPSRLLRLRAGELVGTSLAAIAALVVPFAVMVVLLPRLVEPAPDVPPSLDPRVVAGPLLISLAATVVITVVATLTAARRSALLRPGEVLRDDT